MSVQLTCPKCSKFIGSIWPTDDADWEEIINKFSEGSAKRLCESWNKCYYNK